MATILYKDGKPELIDALHVAACLSNGYTTTAEPVEKPKRKRRTKREMLDAEAAGTLDE